MFTLLKPGSPELEKAASFHGQFEELASRILKLSRENTDVRSLSISLNQKWQATVRCQDALAALEQGIREAPGAGMSYKPESPR